MMVVTAVPIIRKLASFARSSGRCVIAEANDP
jgi:hypothetical protein